MDHPQKCRKNQIFVNVIKKSARSLVLDLENEKKKSVSVWKYYRLILSSGRIVCQFVFCAVLTRLLTYALTYASLFTNYFA